MKREFQSISRRESGKRSGGSSPGEDEHDEPRGVHELLDAFFDVAPPGGVLILRAPASTGFRENGHEDDPEDGGGPEDEDLEDEELEDEELEDEELEDEELEDEELEDEEDET